MVGGENVFAYKTIMVLMGMIFCNMIDMPSFTAVEAI
jgi:hypothetical protein